MFACREIAGPLSVESDRSVGVDDRKILDRLSLVRIRTQQEAPRVRPEGPTLKSPVPTRGLEKRHALPALVGRGVGTRPRRELGSVHLDDDRLGRSFGGCVPRAVGRRPAGHRLLALRSASTDWPIRDRQPHRPCSRNAQLSWSARFGAFTGPRRQNRSAVRERVSRRSRASWSSGEVDSSVSAGSALPGAWGGQGPADRVSGPSPQAARRRRMLPAKTPCDQSVILTSLWLPAMRDNAVGRHRFSVTRPRVSRMPKSASS